MRKMKIHTDPECDSPETWPWVRSDGLVEIHQPYSEIGLEVFFASSASGFWPHSDAEEMVRSISRCFESGAIRVFTIPHPSGDRVPVVIVDHTRDGRIPEYPGNRLAVNGYCLGDLPHVEVVLKPNTITTRKVDGKPVTTPGNYALSVGLSDGYINGRGSGRELEQVKFEDGTPIADMQYELSRLIERLRAGEFDLTPEHVIRANNRFAANEILKSLSERPTREEYEAFCRENGIDPFEDGDRLDHFCRHYDSALGETDADVTRLVGATAHYRRWDRVKADLQERVDHVDFPIDRETYESVASGCGLTPLSDEECADLFHDRFLFLSSGKPQKAPDLPITIDELHALRGAAWEIERRDEPKPPIRKEGQLWQPCGCGNEPVHLPLELCDDCWPEPDEDERSPGPGM